MGAITAEEYSQRRHKVRSALEEEGLDAVIAFSNAKVQANVRYLTSYYVRFAGYQQADQAEGGYYMFGSCACLMPADGEPVVRTDQMWDIARAKEMSIYPDVDATHSLGTDLGVEINRRGYKRVAIDNWYIFPARDYLDLQEAAPDTEFVGSRILSEIRRVKSPGEIALMRKAEEIADASVQAGMDAVRVGATEYEVGLVAESKLRELGELENGGGSIISAGPNSATGSSLPVRDKVLEPGEWVLFDVLPRYEGYCGDIARMRLVGDMDDLDPQLKHLHSATVLMNEEVIRSVKLGVTPKELNNVAVEVAEAEGVAEYKIPLVGHGVGLDIHDLPDYYWDDSPLSAGEVFTIEPCLLMPGVAGTRIEDVVLVTDDGCDVLTKTPKGLAKE
jgi:Xaa-Pro aminopeptidase